jgi:phage-related minor tail protein
LMKSELSDDVIEKQMKQFETEEKTALAVSVVNKMVTEKKMKAEEATKKIAELTANMIAYNDSLDANLILQRQQQFDASISSLNKQLELAGIIDPRAEQRQKYIQEGLTPGQADEKVKLEEQLAAVTKLRDGYRGLADSIGNSFGQAFKGVISGSMTAREALAGFFQSIADSFLDMVAQMIAAWMRTMLLQGFQSLFGSVLGGMGGGFKFPGTTGLGTNFSAAIGNSTNIPFQFANGGIAPGGFRAFASGGVVTGPTLGLVGEGRYNEAVIPLPDGKSVPVDLRGGSNGSNGPVNVVVNVDAKGSTVEGDEDKANELGRAISAAVQSELIKQQRPGGMLSGPRR